MRPTFALWLILPALLISSCSSAPTSGEVSRKITDREAAVNLGSNKLNSGDSVAVYKEICDDRFLSDRPRTPQCKDVELGRGTVVSTSSRSSIVRFDSSVDYEEGDKILRR